MKSANRMMTVAALATCLVISAGADAATISWSATPYVNEDNVSGSGVKDLTGTGQFAVDGTLLAARNYGNQFPGPNGNDTTLVGGGTDGSDIDFGTDGDAPLGWGQSNTAYHSAIANKVTAGGAFDASAGAKTLIMGTGGNFLGDLSFVTGQQYRVQYLIYDGRDEGFLGGSEIKVDGVNYGSFATGEFGVSWGDGLLLTGYWIADGPSQSFSVEIIRNDDSSAGGQINAILVHAVPAPAALPAGLAMLAVGATRRRRR